MSFRRSRGKASVLVFPVLDPAALGSLRLVAKAGAEVSGLSAVVTLNESEVGVVDLRPSFVTHELPLAEGRRGLNRLEFSYPKRPAQIARALAAQGSEALALARIELSSGWCRACGVTKEYCSGGPRRLDMPASSEIPTPSRMTLRNRKRPRHLTDFDVNYGPRSLKTIRHVQARRVWAGPLWPSVAFTAFLLAVIGGGWRALRNPAIRLPADPLWKGVALAAAVLFLVMVVMAVLAGALNRGRLMLNLQDRTLTFYRFLLWPRPAWRVALSDINVLEVRSLNLKTQERGAAPSTSRVVIAELKDGRLASVAFDSSSSVEYAILDALAQPQPVAQSAPKRR